MELEIKRQALGLLCFFGLGLVLGLVYDLLRPIRYRLKNSFVTDFIFCAAGAGATFFLSMGSGRLGLWEILICLLSFCLYINLLSPVILPSILKIFELISGLFYSIARNLKKFTFNVKKVLYK